ncbi:CBS domain-containing protein [Ammoniphilus sp. 3BR4]|uniref:CBS domain-containing protein n=1 Tax=Ammoniphilus sp. 3BR4 TaxID=3158265 RepID=UPI0034668883
MSSLGMDKKQFMSQEIRSLVLHKDKIVTMHPDWTLERALVKLTRSGYTSVPVINSQNQVEGLISKTLILDFMSENQNINYNDLPNYFVHQAMNRNYMGIWENTPLSFALELMIDRAYVPIIDKTNVFMGILTRQAVLQKILNYFSES